MKRLFVLGFLVLLGCTTKPSTLKEYYDSMDYACSQDTDCTIKDVHNCCGVYPQCVNKGTTTDVELVRTLCEKQGVASVCGFPSVESCACVNKKCTSK